MHILLDSSHPAAVAVAAESRISGLLVNKKVVAKQQGLAAKSENSSQDYAAHGERQFITAM